MKYKITKMRERPKVIDGETVLFVRTWYEVPLLQYRGVVEMLKEHFSADKVQKKIREEVKVLMSVEQEGEIEDTEK